MKYLLLISFTLLCNELPAQNGELLLGKVQKVADGFLFTEGPTADQHGNVYFTDIPNKRIHIWTITDQLETILENTGGGNGLFFNKKGDLIVCEGKKRRVMSLSPKGKYQVITHSFEGKKYNRPNDVWVDPKGGIYFTDPGYFMNKSKLEMDCECIYYISPDKSTVKAVSVELVRPNGILGSSDGKSLYIVEDADNRTWEYSIKPDGSIENKRLFANVGDDGLALDIYGNIYLANKYKSAIDIFNPKGKLLRSVTIPEVPSNLCFGGENMDTLFVTAFTSLYAIKTNAKGQDYFK